MYDVISFGSITVDVFLGTEASEMDGKLQYPAGTKIYVKDIDFHTGGCGMNIAIGLKRMGCRTALLGKFGDDLNAIMIKDVLRKEGIPFLGPKGNGRTGYSVVLDSKKHNRTILHYRGASNTFKPKELRKSKIKAKWLYMASALGDTFRTQKVLAGIAARRGIKIAYNPGINECRKGSKHLREILRATEMAIMNKGEAAALSKQAETEDMLTTIRRMGPKIVCITNGNNDTQCYENGVIFRLKPHDIRVKERTGAGDAFSAGVVAGMAKGKGIEHSLQLGLANSESVIQYFGATNKLLSWRNANQMIIRKPGKVKKGIA